MYHIFVSILLVRVCHDLSQFMNCHDELYTCHHEGQDSCSFTPDLHASIFLLESHASSFLCSGHPLCALHCFQGEMGEGTWCFHFPSQADAILYICITSLSLVQRFGKHDAPILYIFIVGVCVFSILYVMKFIIYTTTDMKNQSVSNFPPQAILGKF